MRDNSVSISKAIGIMLMVLAHTWFSQAANQWINMFHMPLFFFLSGYCFKEKYLYNLKSFVQKRIKGIYVPFLKWTILFLLLHNIFFKFNIINDIYGYRGSTSSLYSLHDIVFHLYRIVIAMSDFEEVLGGYWFLKSLFYSSFLGYFFIKFFSYKISLPLSLLLALVVSFFGYCIPIIEVGLPEFLGVSFYLSGYAFANMGGVEHLRTSNIVWVLIGSIVMISVGAHFWQASVTRCEWWKVVPYFVTAILGAVSILLLSKVICGTSFSLINKILISIGDNTFQILTWHFLCFKVVSLSIILLFDLPIEHLAEFPVLEVYSVQGWFIAYFLVGLFLPLAFSKFRLFR